MRSSVTESEHRVAGGSLMAGVGDRLEMMMGEPGSGVEMSEMSMIGVSIAVGLMAAAGVASCLVRVANIGLAWTGLPAGGDGVASVVPRLTDGVVGRGTTEHARRSATRL